MARTILKMLGMVVLAVLCMATGWLLFRGSLSKALIGKDQLARAESAMPSRTGEKSDPRPAPSPAESKDRNPPFASSLQSPAQPSPKPLPNVSLKPLTPKEDQPLASLGFEKQVLPIFEANCIGCHGREAKKGKLDMRTIASLMAGGKNGPAFTPGSLEKSTVWEAVDTGRMPPGKKKLSEADKMLIHTWILQGPKNGDRPIDQAPAP